MESWPSISSEDVKNFKGRRFIDVFFYFMEARWEIFMDWKISETARVFHAEHRGNCAMSVAYAYARATGKSEAEAVEAAEMFRNFGGGRAPNGTCGALYAAKMMQPDHADALEDFFKRGAKGCSMCKQIRPSAVIPCNRCVELAGEALDFLNG